jgi:hypothetical protein
MTDDQIQKMVMEEIRKRDITYYDMTGLPGHGVDPNPQDHITPLCRKGVRSNRFKTMLGCDRMKELLCAGKYNPYDDTLQLRIPFQDLFRFWWNRCVVQEYVVDDLLEDVFEFFTSLMTPPDERPKQEEMEVFIDFDQLSLFLTGMDRAA